MTPLSHKQFEHGCLTEDAIHNDPFSQFSLWWQEAQAANVELPDAVHLATVDSQNHPDVRVVFLKHFDERGFVFFTNYQSAKALQIASCAWAAINIFWPALERQIRLRGTIEKTSTEENVAYFATRPRGSQIGAWASPQSTPIADRQTLETLFADKQKQFANQDIPCPDHWGGFRLIPNTIEFWQGRTNRFHDRFLFVHQHQQWQRMRLAP